MIQIQWPHSLIMKRCMERIDNSIDHSKDHIKYNYTISKVVRLEKVQVTRVKNILPSAEYTFVLGEEKLDKECAIRVIQWSNKA